MMDLDRKIQSNSWPFDVDLGRDGALRRPGIAVFLPPQRTELQHGGLDG
jgi:hypothetical protein